MKFAAGTLLGALLTVGAATGCSTSATQPQESPSAATAQATATPTPDDWYEMQDGTQVDIYADQPLPEVVMSDAQVALQAAAGSIDAANLPADGMLAHGQDISSTDAFNTAESLQKRLSAASGRTALVVYPIYGSLDGESFSTLWSLLPDFAAPGIMASASKESLVAELTQWAEQAGPEYFVVAP